MATTSNKGYILQAFGDNAGTWGTTLNDDMISIVDRNVGGVLSKDISTTGNITLTNVTPTWEAQQGTLVLTGNPAYVTYPIITISTPAVGFLFVQNAITLNGTAYPQIRIKNSSNATYAVVPANTSALIILDTTYGARLAGQTGFETGVSTLFFNSSAPYGWTKSTTHNNKALRIVSSSGGGTGGSVAFTSAFTSQSVLGAIGDTTLTVDQIPPHTHTFTYYRGPTRGETTSSSYLSNTALTGTTNSTGGGQPHSHTFTGTNINLAVSYVDAIICVKD